MDKTRITWIDTFKGISILLVVVGHLQSPYFTYIYLIHIALFFLISGYTYRSESEKLLSYAKRKTVGLIIPFYLLNILFVFLTNLMNEMILSKTTEVGGNTLADSFAGLFSETITTTELGGPSWFLPVLFETEILSHLIIHLMSKSKFLKRIKEFALFIPGGIGYYCEMKLIWLPFRFDLALCACMLLGLGMLIKKAGVLEKVPRFYGGVISSVILLFFGGAYFKGTMPVNWASREFPKLWVFLLCSLMGFYFVYWFSNILGDIKIHHVFSFMGQNTFPIMMYHFLFFRLLSLILYQFKFVGWEDILQSPLIRPTYCLWIGYAAFSIACCLIISCVSKRVSILDYLVNARWKRKEKGGAKHGAK